MDLDMMVLFWEGLVIGGGIDNEETDAANVVLGLDESIDCVGSTQVR